MNNKLQIKELTLGIDTTTNPKRILGTARDTL